MVSYLGYQGANHGYWLLTTPVGISEKLHFPTCSSDWDLELAQYLAECKVINTGTSQHCRQSPNLFQKFQ